METVDPLDSGSSRFYQDMDDDALSSTDSNLSDIPMTTMESPKAGKSDAQQIPGLCLNLPPRGPQVVPLTVRSGDGSTSISVDLLSTAFRLKQETVRQAREWGWSLEQIIGAGFTSALDIPKKKLRYYVVQEVAHVDEIGEGCRHLAVGIEGSSFTLGAVEDMLDKNRKTQQILNNYKQQLEEESLRVARLEQKLDKYDKAMRIQEHKCRQLQRDNELLRRAAAGREQVATPISDSLVSPRLLATRGGVQQLRAPAAIARLRESISQNQQLVKDLERLSKPEIWASCTSDSVTPSLHLDLPDRSHS